MPVVHIAYYDTIALNGMIKLVGKGEWICFQGSGPAALTSHCMMGCSYQREQSSRTQLYGSPVPASSYPTSGTFLQMYLSRCMIVIIVNHFCIQVTCAGLTVDFNIECDEVCNKTYIKQSTQSMR